MQTPQDFGTTMVAKTDKELLKILAQPEDWTPEVISAAKMEMEKRGLDASISNASLVSESPNPLRSEVASQGLNLKQLTTIGIGGGILLQVIGLYTYAIPQANAGFVGFMMRVFGTILFLWGCKNFAVGKGYNKWLGALGLFSCAGLFVLILLPDRRKEFDDHA